MEKKIENQEEQNKLEVTFSLPVSAPAVARIGHVQLPLQVDNGEGRAAASDIVDLLLPLDLNILGAAQIERESLFFFFVLVHLQ